MHRTAVIPIKQLANAKQRLAKLLNVVQRQELFQAMVEDVLDATSSCYLIDEVMVVTSDTQAAALAIQYGARVLAEPNQPGLIQAVDYAAERLVREGVDSMLFLPGDVPLVTIEELEVVLGGMGQSQQTEFLIVPSHDLGGSNCILASPPNCIEYAFGIDSFRRHLTIARAAGIEPMVAKLPGIGLDIDTPQDLAQLNELLDAEQQGSHTANFLQGMQLRWPHVST